MSICYASLVRAEVFDRACEDLGVALGDESREGSEYRVAGGCLTVEGLADDILLLLGQQLSLRAGHDVELLVAEARGGSASIYRAVCSGATHTAFELTDSTDADELECEPEDVLGFLIDGAITAPGLAKGATRQGTMSFHSMPVLRVGVEAFVVHDAPTPVWRMELATNGELHFVSEDSKVTGRFELRSADNKDHQLLRTLVVMVDLPAAVLSDAIGANWVALGVGRFDRVRTKHSAADVVLPLPTQQLSVALMEQLLIKPLVELDGPRDEFENDLGEWVKTRVKGEHIGKHLAAWLLERDDVVDVFGSDEDVSAAWTMACYTLEKRIEEAAAV